MPPLGVSCKRLLGPTNPRAKPSFACTPVGAISARQGDGDHLQDRFGLGRDEISDNPGSQRAHGPQSSCHEIGAAMGVVFEQESSRVSLTERFRGKHVR